MTKVSGHTNLYRRDGGSYSYMCRIPKRLQPAFVKPDGTPQPFLKVALGTKDTAEAHRPAPTPAMAPIRQSVGL